MASICRSAAMAAARSITVGSKTLISKSAPSYRRTAHSISRCVMALDITESLMPLHSAIASAHLKSIIAVDSTSWSWLSQGRALPL